MSRVCGNPLARGHSAKIIDVQVAHQHKRRSVLPWFPATPSDATGPSDTDLARRHLGDSLPQEGTIVVSSDALQRLALRRRGGEVSLQPLGWWRSSLSESSTKDTGGISWLKIGIRVTPTMMPPHTEVGFSVIS
jgi:hypothetical protein